MRIFVIEINRKFPMVDIICDIIFDSPWSIIIVFGFGELTSEIYVF